MDAYSLEALVYDPSKSSKLSMEQKRDLVYEVSNWSDAATEILHAWSRQEILEILCAELGKERKYTGLTKSKIIEQLLKVVCEKKSQESAANVSESQPENGERVPKRQRKSDQPNRLPVAGNVSTATTPDVDIINTIYCKNSACKAKLNGDDAFCKRCSCCICRQYDDNKDPSLWLNCNSDPPFHGISCGMSCHLECALCHENSGISKDRQDKGLDGSFSCVSCGKVNDLLGSWRKQLVVARDTRRVDILGYRLSLAQKILAGTKQYQVLCGDIDEAVQMLEEEVGPLTGLPVKKARGIVNRLSSGPEIQRICASAVDSLDSMLSERLSKTPTDRDALASKFVQFEDICASSLNVVMNPDDSNVGYVLWHRKADDKDYPEEPTCRLFAPNTKFLLSGLTPATRYFLKVVITVDKDTETGPHEFQFRTGDSENETSQSPTTNCSSLSNPSSVEDENENRGYNSLPFNDDKTAAANSLGKREPNEDDDIANLKNKESLSKGLECVPCLETGLQITPCKVDNAKEGGNGRKNNKRKIGTKGVIDISSEEEPQAGSSSKKRSGKGGDGECSAGIGDKDFEYYVKVIRLLECDGHIETEFRQKFLTWYSLRASPQMVRIVKVFIDTFIEDPESLAGQLVDTFSDVVSNKRCSALPSGFCLKLWH